MGRRNHHEQPDAIPLNRRPFIGLIPDPRVVGQGDPAFLPDQVQPLFVRAVVSVEVISKSFHSEPGVLQDFAEPQAEISVREVDDTQAARS
jgi:hypothetical protein